MDTSLAIKTRLDVREFSDQPVNRDDVIAIIDAGRMAGSGKNTQHWRFILIEGREKLRELASVSTTGKWVADASFAVIVLTDRKFPYHKMDAGRAITNMQLEAWNRGIVSCIYTGFDEDEMRRRYNVPENYSIDVVVGFGRPKRKILGKKSRRPLSELLYVDKFGQRL
ncbi:MAG: nitroreductase family protein [Aigarchaeota archaeon]|nr:nitroreductase family protein [Aigarchaeota archaeon]MDW8092946.1 nitroreductase family protein [Nitrososphaerota archaeon]